MISAANTLPILALVVLLCGVSHRDTEGSNASGQGSVSPVRAAATYYVDSAGGDDQNGGISPQTPWKTLEKVNNETFSPGSRILLKAGGVYSGGLRLTSPGSEDHPNVVDRYGEGPNPRLETGGVVVQIENTQFWEVRNLEVCGGRTGVLVQLKDYGVARHIHLMDLEIHDIHGGTTGDNSGILCINSGVTTRFDGLLIKNCAIRHADRNGILVTDWPGPTDEHRSTNVVIHGNRLSDIGGDGIFILACKDAIIERNVLRYAHQRVARGKGERACAGIWPHRCDDTLIQFNEVSHTAVGGKTVWDSEAFDDDSSCTGSIFQYNYSHDNAGGFMLVCGGRGTIVRYNISQNDATATFTFESDRVSDCAVYNNTVFVSEELDVELVRNTFGAPDGIRFLNNIFLVRGKARYSIRGIKDLVFDHNCFFGNHVALPSDAHAVATDPLLEGPGSGAEGLDSLDGYRLRVASPCIRAGTAVPDNGGHDLWGSAVPETESPNIGAHQR